ncbi:MAG: class I SAM-dependent methyltransferase [Hyphomonadaceae bacterium]|nr:class I SAM-dependent methyltransferase [Hyphomonadaceae bacterium]
MKHLFFAAAALSLAACSPPAQQETPPLAQVAVSPDAANIVAALADTRRPAEDTARDAARHPAETLAFAGIEEGDKVGEIFPGGGYFTRLFAVGVGESGRVYPTIRPDGVAGEYETPVLAVAAQYPNAVMARTPYDALAYPEPLDVIFTAQNYHDMPLTAYALGDRARMNATAFAALKPGGVYVIIDHAANAGAAIETDAETALHRIDPAVLRSEVEAAGFVFDGESDVLRNAADPHTASVFDPAIRGQTDQFMMRFRKPE